MTRHADGKHGYRAWDKDRPGLVAPEQAAFPPQAYLGPFQSNSERLMTQAIAVGQMTSEEVQEYVRPNLPQVELFPDKFGYTITEFGIKDIVELQGRAVQQRVESDHSQLPNTTQSTSRNTLGGSV
jgi:hypothetical protein